MRWFRLYDGVLDDPKVQQLPDNAFRAWINLMCLASRNGGRIPDDAAGLSFSLRLSQARVRALLQALITAGLIDREEAGLTPHNWAGRQYVSDVSTARVKRFRERERGVAATAPESEAEKIRTDAAARAAWGGHAAPLVDQIGAACFQAWFAKAAFEPGPPPRLILPTRYLRERIEQKFEPALRRAFGKFDLKGPA